MRARDLTRLCTRMSVDVQLARCCGEAVLVG